MPCFEYGVIFVFESNLQNNQNLKKSFNQGTISGQSPIFIGIIFKD